MQCDNPGEGDYTCSEGDYADCGTSAPVVVVGCMDESAVNFDPTANQDSDECAFATVAAGEVTVVGCMVPSALVNTRNSQ